MFINFKIEEKVIRNSANKFLVNCTGESQARNDDRRSADNTNNCVARCCQRFLSGYIYQQEAQLMVFAA